MPEYLWECENGHVTVLEYGMHDDRPEYIDCWECGELAYRKFTIPGLSVKYEDEWIERMPGEVHRERRDKRWRDKHGKGADRGDGDGKRVRRVPRKRPRFGYRESD